MKKRSHRKKSRISTVITIAAAFGAVMYYKNRLIPKYADDYPYSFVWDGKNNGNLAFGKQNYKRVKNAGDLVRSQWSHYLTWDGRTIAESLVQSFLIPDDKKYFDRANTAVMLSQLYLCASIAKGRPVRLRDISPYNALLLTAGFYACAPHLVASCFWLTGSMNYMWVGILQSLFVLPYSMHYHGSADGFPKSLMFILGMMAGWTTETGAGAAFLTVLMATLYARKHGGYGSWMSSGLYGELLGIALLLLAPGNRKKFRIESEESDTLPATLDDMLPGYVPVEYLYTPLMFKMWFKDGFMTTVIRELPLHIPVMMYFADSKIRDRRTDLFMIALEAVTFAVPSVMMLSPEYPRRATYPSVIYLLAAAYSAVEKLDPPPFGEWSKGARRAAVLAGTALLVNLISGLIVDADMSVQIEDQIREVQDRKDEESIYLDDIGWPPLYGHLASDRSVTDDVSMGLCMDNPDDPYNKAAAAYYGVNEIYCGDYTDHEYTKTDPESVFNGIVKPVKNLIRKTKELFVPVFRLLCIFLCVLILGGCGRGQGDTSVSENVSQTMPVSDEEPGEKTRGTELAEAVESEDSGEEDGDESENEEPPGPGYEVLFTPVITEALDAIENGYRDDREYEFFSVGLMEKIMYEDRESILENVGYALVDMNGDGYSELLIGYDGKDSNTSETDSYILDAYVLKGTTPVCVIDGMVHNNYRWMGGGYLYYLGSGGAANTFIGKCHLSEDGKQVVWDDFYFSQESEEDGTEEYYHNNSGDYDPQDSEKLDTDHDTFMNVIECTGFERISWTPIGTFGKGAQDGTDSVDATDRGVTHFTVPGIGAGKIKADLDGNGEEEVIGYRVDATENNVSEKLCLTIEGEQNELTEGLHYNADNGLECFWFRTNSGRSRFLYVQYVTDEGFTDVAMYRFAGRKFRYLGNLDGAVMYGNYTDEGEYVIIEPTDPLEFSVRHVEQILGTQVYVEKCYLGSDGRPAFNDEYKYYLTHGDPHIRVTKTIPCKYLESEKSTHENPSAIWKNSMVTPFRTDGETFIDLKVEGDDYEVYRIYIGQNEDGRWCLTYKEGLYGSEILTTCFTGLYFVR